MSRSTDTNDIESRARRRVGMKLGFYTHALVYVLVNLGLVRDQQRVRARQLARLAAARLGPRAGDPRHRDLHQPARRRRARAHARARDRAAAQQALKRRRAPIESAAPHLDAAPTARARPMSAPKEEIKPGNFLRAIIERDLEAGTYAQRRFAGTPGDAAHHAAGPPDPARIRTRFPPEPNGYLHIGHAKSICLNFGLARDYGGVCHLRFDDTNPEKEEQEYVDAILESVRWLGFSWDANGTSHLYYASDYFDFMYRAAEALIEAGLAYVDEQSADEMRAQPRRLQHARHRQPVPRPHAGREPGALSRDARRPARRWRGRAAREDRHGEPEHQPARPGAVPHQARDAPQHRRPLVHLPDVHLRAPDRGRAGEHHAQHLHARVRGPAAVLRLAARHAVHARPARAAAAAPVSSSRA